MPADLPFNYREIGATGEVPFPPPGYSADTYTVLVGHGAAVFERVFSGVLDWQLQLRAGLHIEADGPMESGITAHQYLRLGPILIDGPVGVIECQREARHQSVTLGALAGHPESGEERFSVRLDPDDRVMFEMRIMSRPARWYCRLGYPVSRVLQKRLHRRYLTAAKAISAS